MESIALTAAISSWPHLLLPRPFPPSQAAAAGLALSYPHVPQLSWGCLCTAAVFHYSTPWDPTHLAHM